eukprot:CAMPEP_0173198194 /NCGR_PEP_ID=MMETSP1141-20130122/16559_1 /TAXON_ID=483371 /ORGANISM="non described non described, Strain CCMP2298" /LENGTH=200 /DNA_ID=CAMNT_0014122975 /DNA_START=234 /DNA_END=833 /DNA_ORIENTATION=+
MASIFAERIAQLQEVYRKGGSSTRADDSALNKSIYFALGAVREAVELVPVGEGKCFGTDNLGVLEEVVMGTGTAPGGVVAGLVVLIRPHLVVLVSLYCAILRRAPGYVTRSVLNSMLAICNAKKVPDIGRDCAVQIIGAVMNLRVADCANQINEVLIALARLAKSSDAPLRVSCLRALSAVVTGAGVSAVDTHAEVFKSA